MTPFILQKVNDLTEGKSLQAIILLTSVLLRSYMENVIISNYQKKTKNTKQLKTDECVVLQTDQFTTLLPLWSPVDDLLTFCTL